MIDSKLMIAYVITIGLFLTVVPLSFALATNVKDENRRSVGGSETGVEPHAVLRTTRRCADF